MKKSFLFYLLIVCFYGLNAQIINIPDANFKAKLIALGVDTNVDGQIQQTEALAVTWLNLINSSIVDMTGIEEFINLDSLVCANNFITNLNLSTLVNLTDLYCAKNQIQSIQVNHLTNLKSLGLSENLLDTLIIDSLVNLEYLDCSYNFLTDLQVNSLTNIRYLRATANNLTTLELSNLNNLQIVYGDSNQLSQAFIKNGSNEWWVILYPNPIQYVCADSSQIIDLQQYFLQVGLPNVVVSSFCSFPPNGSYNTILGKNIYDANINGCTTTDPVYPYLMLQVNNGIDSGYVYSDINGNYQIYTDSGTFTIKPKPESPAYFSISPSSSTFYFPNNNNNTQIQDFCIAPTGSFPDVEVLMIPIFATVPGTTAYFYLWFHNKGTTTASGDITLNFMGANMTTGNISPPPITQTSSQIVWSYNNLAPFESREITFHSYILPPPTNNVGDTLIFDVNISLLNDVDTSDNHFVLKQPVLNSYDPNDKTCLEGEYVSNTEIGDYLHYLIRFQNTGNYYAEKVVVIDSIDASKFDIASLQILDVSHNVQIRVENNTIEFYFDQIMLPDSFTNEPASHGHILFKIKTHNNLSFNSTIKNKAEIYFDYNPPIITNYATTHFYSDCANFTTNVLLTPVTCNGLCDGMISTNPIGAIGPYTYSWSNGATSSTLNNVCAGTYWVNVADASGCILSNTFVINEPAPLTINIDTIIHALNNANGAIIIEPTGGTSPYTYLWSNGQSSQNATQLVSGVYGITIIDANACEFTLSNIVISEIVNIENALPTDYTISPNPAQNELIIKADKETELTIYNYLGQKITDLTIYGKQNVDISFLAKGLYWIKEKYSQKFCSFVKE